MNYSSNTFLFLLLGILFMGASWSPPQPPLNIVCNEVSDQPELLAEKMEAEREKLEEGGIGEEGMEEIPKPLFERVIKNIFIEYTSEITNLVAEKKLKEVLTDTSQLEDLLNLFTEEEPIVATVKQTLKTAIEAHNKKTLGTLNIQVALKQIDIKGYYERRKHRGKKLSESALRKFFPSSENVAEAFVRLADKTDPNHPDNIKALYHLNEWLRRLDVELNRRIRLTPAWKKTKASILQKILSGEFPYRLPKLEQLFIANLNTPELPNQEVYKILRANIASIRAYENKIELLGALPKKLDLLPADSTILKTIEAYPASVSSLYEDYIQALDRWYKKEFQQLKVLAADSLALEVDLNCLNSRSSTVFFQHIPKNWTVELLNTIKTICTDAKLSSYQELSIVVQGQLFNFKERYKERIYFEEFYLKNEAEVSALVFPTNLKLWLFDCH